MNVDVLLGLQWGDEGKGKIVDVLTSGYDVICRFQGGPNAGHTLEIGNVQHILHSIPSGIFREKTINLIGNGVVLDPIVFMNEIKSLAQIGIDLKDKLLISKKAHLILPTHRLLDKASEAAKGKTKIGSTLKGIGPTYMDKTGRNGLRVGDIVSGNFKERYDFLKEKHKGILKQYDQEYNTEEGEKEWFEGIELIRSFQLVDSEHVVNKYIEDNKKILAEGAQGTLLDIDFGSYPYVTSSNTICAGACTGLGIAPRTVGEVIGIFKAYCTRVGSGPFPTELHCDTGQNLRDAGHEYGSTTGRPRRCGWLDLVALKYAIMLNGATKLIITKTDVLSDFDTLKICTGYKINGETVEEFPHELSDDLEPVYTEFPGWNQDIKKITREEDLPKELMDYIKFIEEQVNVPIVIVSVGPERNETVVRKV
jgi:adenylosuccinate synthase